MVVAANILFAIYMQMQDDRWGSMITQDVYAKLFPKIPMKKKTVNIFASKNFILTVERRGMVNVEEYKIL